MLLARAPIPVVVMQHVEEAAHLRHVRSVLVRAPHVRLLQLGRLDERIAAHLDGIAVAGAYGARLAQQALERPGAGEVFAATVGALVDKGADHDADRLDTLLAIADALPASRRGLLSAFGWVAAADLQGITKTLLVSPLPERREVGLAACAMHGVDPGAALTRAVDDPDPALRARALQGAGRAGRRDLLHACLAHLADPAPRCAFEAARSALWLGDRTAALAALEALAPQPDAGDAGVAHAAWLTLLKAVPATPSPGGAGPTIAVPPVAAPPRHVARFDVKVKGDGLEQSFPCQDVSRAGCFVVSKDALPPVFSRVPRSAMQMRSAKYTVCCVPPQEPVPS